MKLRTAASAALLLAFASLPVNPLLSPAAHAFGVTQTAPSGPAARPSSRSAPRAAQGLAPSPYFDRGTRVPLAPPVVRHRAHRKSFDNDHHRKKHRQRNDRVEVSRPQAGSVGLRRIDAEPAGPAIAQTRPANPRTIDTRTPHASRDTAGISFWPKRTVSTAPRTSALRFPQFPYFGPPPGTRTDRLSRGAQRFDQRGGSWFFSAGYWYRSHRLGGYAVVLPPIGLALPFLPVGSEEIYFEGQPFYNAGGVTLQKADDEYLVVNAPLIAPSDQGYYIESLDQIAEPIRGQSERRFGRDVDRCESRAEARSGYDPELENASNAAERRYRSFSRTLSRCLQTAGYSLY